MALRHYSERFAASGLQRFFERITDRLRPDRRGSPDEIVQVSVDLVGESSSPKNNHPFQNDRQIASAVSDDSVLQREWSFRESVVLRRTQRGSRLLLYITLGISAAGIIWIVAAPLNQTILVKGKLEPNTKVKLIQTPVPGLVDQVLVEEGESVKSGQLLLRFDLREARNQLNSAQTIKRQLEEENSTFAASLGDSAVLSKLNANQRDRLNSQKEELLNRRQVAFQQLKKSQVKVAGLEKSVATARNIADRYEGLIANGAMSIVQLLEARNKQQELSTSLAEEQREVLRLQGELRSSYSGPSSDLRGRIEVNRRLIAEQQEKINNAMQQLKYGELRAPVNGITFDLDARRGSVAQAGQSLLRIVPYDALQARVYLPSNVIGFIKPGQVADISLDTFPAADYGRLPAIVKRVGTDALTPENQKEALGNDTNGLFYPALLTLRRQTLQAGKKNIALQPGMTLEADIQLRQRRMINVLTGFFEDKLRSLERIR